MKIRMVNGHTYSTIAEYPDDDGMKYEGVLKYIQSQGYHISNSYATDRSRTHTIRRMKEDELEPVAVIGEFRD